MLEILGLLIAAFLCFPLILDVLSGGTASNQVKTSKPPAPKEPQHQKDDVFDDLLDEMTSAWEQSEKGGSQLQEDDLSGALDNFSAELDALLVQCEEDK